MLKTIFSLPADLYRNRRLVMKLAKNDFKTRYAGSYFGTIWAFVQPVVTILVYWFVFSVGFRSNTDELGIPFVLYYFPDSTPIVAVRHLMRWIARCAPLLHALEATGYHPCQKSFTCRQLQLVYLHLGEP